MTLVSEDLWLESLKAKICTPWIGNGDGFDCTEVRLDTQASDLACHASCRFGQLLLLARPQGPMRAFLGGRNLV